MDEVTPPWSSFQHLAPAPMLVRRREWETAPSVLVRLSLANGMRDVNHLLRSLTDSRCRVSLTRDAKIELAARLGDLDAAEMAGWTPVRMTGARMTVAGAGFPRAGTLPGRLCPMCIREDLSHFTNEREELRAFRRGWWQVPPVTTCPIHQVLLVSHCGCGQAYRELQPAGLCGCGTVVVGAQTVAAADCAHDAWLLGRLGVGQSVASPMLDTMPMHTASGLCHVVGRAIAGERPGRSAVKEPGGEAHFRSEGWRLLAGGKPALARLLDGIVTKQRQAGRFCNTSYAGIHPFLTQNDCPSLAPLREMMTRHAEDNLGLYDSGARLFGRMTFAGERISITRAADALNAAERMLTRVLIAVDPQHAGDTISSGLLERRQFILLRDVFANSVRTSHARDLLGFDQRILIAAETAGLLDLIIPVENSFGLIRRGSIEALQRLFSRPKVARKFNHLVGPGVFAQLAWMSAAKVMLAVATGRLEPAARRKDLPGFLGLLFRPDDARGLRTALSGVVTRGYAERELGWMQGTIGSLCSAGYMRAGHGWSVDMASLVEFRAQYATAREAYAWVAEPLSFLAFCHMVRRGCGLPIVDRRAVTQFWSRASMYKKLRPIRLRRANIHAIGFGSSD